MCVAGYFLNFSFNIIYIIIIISKTLISSPPTRNVESIHPNLFPCVQRKLGNITVFLFRCFQVFGDGGMTVLLVSYRNPSGEGDNGHCCDGRWMFCEIRGCDHYFTVCVDKYDG